jgi:hypothetical protein
MSKKEIEKKIVKLELIIAKLTKRLDQSKRILTIINEV